MKFVQIAALSLLQALACQAAAKWSSKYLTFDKTQCQKICDTFTVRRCREEDLRTVNRFRMKFNMYGIARPVKRGVKSETQYFKVPKKSGGYLAPVNIVRKRALAGKVTNDKTKLPIAKQHLAGQEVVILKTRRGRVNFRLVKDYNAAAKWDIDNVRVEPKRNIKVWTLDEALVEKRPSLIPVKDIEGRVYTVQKSQLEPLGLTEDQVVWMFSRLPLSKGISQKEANWIFDNRFTAAERILIIGAKSEFTPLEKDTTCAVRLEDGGKVDKAAYEMYYRLMDHNQQYLISQVDKQAMKNDYELYWEQVQKWYDELTDADAKAKFKTLFRRMKVLTLY